MNNVITLKQSLDVNKLYTSSDSELFEIIYPFNQNIDSRHAWFAIVARANNTTSTKIKNIFYGTSKLTSIERIYFEDIARKKITEQPQDNVIQFSLRLRGSK